MNKEKSDSQKQHCVKLPFKKMILLSGSKKSRIRREESRVHPCLETETQSGMITVNTEMFTEKASSTRAVWKSILIHTEAYSQFERRGAYLHLIGYCAIAQEEPNTMNHTDA